MGGGEGAGRRTSDHEKRPDGAGHREESCNRECKSTIGGQPIEPPPAILSSVVTHEPIIYGHVLQQRTSYGR